MRSIAVLWTANLLYSMSQKQIVLLFDNDININQVVIQKVEFHKPVYRAARVVMHDNGRSAH